MNALHKTRPIPWHMGFGRVLPSGYFTQTRKHSPLRRVRLTRGEIIYPRLARRLMGAQIVKELLLLHLATDSVHERRC